MGSLRKRLTYANVAATIAVVLAMSGTSYALVVTGTQVQNNSLTGADLKNGSVAALDLMAGSVGSAEVIDSSLKLTDLHPQVKDAHKEKAFLLRSDAEVPIGRGQAEHARVATLNLPPGKYVVNGTFEFRGGWEDHQVCPECGVTTHVITCEIGDPNQGLADPVFERVDFELHSNTHFDEVIPMTFVGGVDGDGLAVNCWRDEQAALQEHPIAKGYVVSAVQVDSIMVP